MKRIVSALALGAALLTAGCHSTQSSTPSTAPTLNQTYSRAAVAMRDFSADVRQAQQIEISLYRGGFIAKPTHVAVQGGFLQVATYGKQIDALILGQAGAATIQAKVSAALQAVEQITLTTGTLDANATAQLKATVQALTLILTQVSTILNTTTTGELYGPAGYRNTGGAISIVGIADLRPVQGGARVRWVAGENGF